jgi:hypothetical protein
MALLPKVQIHILILIWGSGLKLIRCRNTFYYWVLQSSGQYDFMVGKHRNIFYNNNVYAATGKDFVGKEFISNRIKKLAYVADKLSEKGIKLFVVLAPKKQIYTQQIYPWHICRQIA